MFSFVAKALDRWVIRSAAVRFNPPTDIPSRATQAAELLRHPDYFSNAVQAPSDLQFQSVHTFRFTSPIASPWEQNNTVYGKFYRAGRDWQKKPTVILLHGWNAEYLFYYQFPFLARRLSHFGVNALLFELPYHGQRKPAAAPRGYRNFISADLFHMIQATRQAIAETKAVLAWLLAQGLSTVGLWGISMGAWLSGLVISHDARAGFAVLMSPMVNLERAIQELPFCAPIRQALQTANVEFTALNLASFKPRIPPNHILLIESLYEQFVSVDTVEAVWHSWNEPQIWRVPQGHISALLSPLLMERTFRWISRQTQPGQTAHPLFCLSQAKKE